MRSSKSPSRTFVSQASGPRTLPRFAASLTLHLTDCQTLACAFHKILDPSSPSTDEVTELIDALKDGTSPYDIISQATEVHAQCLVDAACRGLAFCWDHSRFVRHYEGLMEIRLAGEAPNPRLEHHALCAIKEACPKLCWRSADGKLQNIQTSLALHEE